MPANRSTLLLPCLILTACGGGGGGGGGGGSTNSLPSTYAFSSTFSPGVSSVNYTGQTYRQANIREIVLFMDGLTNAIDTAAFDPAGDTVLADLNSRYEDTGTNSTRALALSSTPPLLQGSLSAIDTNKSLVGKTAGNDASTDHKDWDNGTAFVGWTDTSIALNGGSITSPEGLIRAFFGTLNKLAKDRGNGMIPNDPSGNPITRVTVTASGLDLRQLIEKFLLMAVAYSQGTDDYLDDDVAAKGLLSSSTAQDGANPWSVLEHQIDEGWGYFGAAINYGDYSDEEISSAGGRSNFQGRNDANGDGFIDLRSEFNYHAAVNAASRDRGSNASAKTNFTQQAFDAFRRLRQIVNQTSGRSVTTAELDEMRVQRNLVVDAWERAIAATVVHYINDVLKNMAEFGTANYSFLDHAKNFSELKGFALGLQFNPRKQISDANFSSFHSLVGDSPVLPNANANTIDAYKTSLRSARTLLQNAYNFSALNIGDDNGNGGW